jgi:hypothetical protein
LQVCRSIEYHRREDTRARETISDFPTKLPAMEDTVTAANAKTAAAAEPSEQQRALQAVCSKYEAAETLDERVALVAQSDACYDQVQLCKARLVALEEEKRAAYSPTPSEDERMRYAQLSTSINRARWKLGTAAARPYLRDRDRLARLKHRLEPLVRERDSAARALEYLIQNKESAERTLARRGT